MEDLLNLPCHCPLNFSEAARNRGLAARHKKVLRAGCPAVLHPHFRAGPLTRARAQDLRPRLYVAVDRTEAPPSQVIATEKQSILLREFYRIGLNHAEGKAAAPKRAASPEESPRPAKIPRQDFPMQ